MLKQMTEYERTLGYAPPKAAIQNPKLLVIEHGSESRSAFLMRRRFLNFVGERLVPLVELDIPCKTGGGIAFSFLSRKRNRTKGHLETLLAGSPVRPGRARCLEKCTARKRETQRSKAKKDPRRNELCMTEVSVRLPGGAIKKAEFIGNASSTGATCLLRFGKLQPLYTFSIKNGKGRGALKEWQIVADDLTRIKGAK